MNIYAIVMWLPYNCFWLLVASIAVSESGALVLTKRSSNRPEVTKGTDLTIAKPDVLLEIGRSYSLEQIEALRVAASKQATNKAGNVPVSPNSDSAAESSTAKVQTQTTLPDVSSSNTFDDEKVAIRKTLRVRYKYQCVHSGIQERDFELQAFYTTREDRLTAHAVLNIHAFEPPLHWTNEDHLYPRTFELGIRGQFCQTYGPAICTYNFYGRIEGSLSGEIVLSIVTAASQQDLRPKVYENCINIANAGGMACPAVTGQQCTIISVTALPT